MLLEAFAALERAVADRRTRHRDAARQRLNPVTYSTGVSATATSNVFQPVMVAASAGLNEIAKAEIAPNDAAGIRMRFISSLTPYQR